MATLQQPILDISDFGAAVKICSGIREIRCVSCLSCNRDGYNSIGATPLYSLRWLYASGGVHGVTKTADDALPYFS